MTTPAPSIREEQQDLVERLREAASIAKYKHTTALLEAAADRLAAVEKERDAWSIASQQMADAAGSWMARLPASSGTGVKELAWGRASDYSFHATAIGLRYYVYFSSGDNGRWYAYTEGYQPVVFGDFATKAAAQAICQSDFESRIRSCLQASPIVGAVASTLCSDCPPEGYPTDATRCTLCPRRSEAVAWIVVRDGKMYLPFIKSAGEAARYREQNPDEILLPLYAHPLPVEREGATLSALPLEWVADHGVAGLGPYRLFTATTPLGTFSYGTDSEGARWYCGQKIHMVHVGGEAAAKRMAEAEWSKRALAEIGKYVAVRLPTSPLTEQSHG